MDTQLPSVYPLYCNRQTALGPSHQFQVKEQHGNSTEYCGEIREVENESWCFSFWLKVLIYLDSLALLYSGSSHYYCYIAHLKEVSGVVFFNDALLIFLRNKHQYFVAHLRGQKLYGSQICSLD